MKPLILALTTCGVGLLFSATLQSQTPGAPKSSLQSLQEMKARNQQMLEKQAKTLLQLDELQKEAQQIKALGARS
ncbi:MAG TPA: hypothetical protein VF614_06840 [Chthoniobacteraceae bacterium]|jgi:hypothetical protein